MNNVQNTETSARERSRSYQLIDENDTNEIYFHFGHVTGANYNPKC